jgi:ABC-type enterochelin transport system substrate-binding protein
MHKTVLAVFALIIALLLLVQWFGGRRQAIAQALAAASHLRLQRDSLLAEVEERDRERATLISEREEHEAEIAQLRESVAQLEESRVEAQLSVREIRTTGALQSRLRTTFPELGPAGWGLTTLPFADGDTLGLEYLLVPAWFAETFIIDHANAASWRAQKDRLLEVDSLHFVVAWLQDSVTQLEAANAAAYATGYDAAHAGYQDLSDRYVAELRKPRFKLPSLVGFVGAVGVGFVVGRVAR